MVGINANESNDQPKNGLDKLLQLTHLIEVISQKYDTRKESNIYSRGSKRIDFFLFRTHIYIQRQKWNHIIQRSHIF